MTVVGTPVWIQSGGETAEYARRAQSATMGLRGGVVGFLDLLVSQHAGTPDMSVDVAGGQVWIPGDEATYQGLYLCENRGIETVTIAAADSTNARKDLIVAQVRDAGYSGASNDFRIVAVTGTPAGSPADPTVPDNSWVLARVDVPASDTAITTGQITDLRTGAASYTAQGGRAAALGGVVVCTSSFRPTVGLYEGLVAYETDTNQAIVYDGSAWVEVARFAGWNSSFTPTLTQGVTVSKTTTYSRYQKIGRMVTWSFSLAVTSSGTGGQNVSLNLPFTAVGTGNHVVGYGSIANGGTNNFGPAVLATTTELRFFTSSSYFNAGLVNTNVVSATITYEATS